MLDSSFAEQFVTQPNDEARWHWVAAQQSRNNSVKLYLGHQATYIVISGRREYFDHCIGQEYGIGVLLSMLGIHGELAL